MSHNVPSVCGALDVVDWHLRPAFCSLIVRCATVPHVAIITVSWAFSGESRSSVSCKCYLDRFPCVLSEETSFVRCGVRVRVAWVVMCLCALCVDVYVV